MEGKSWSPQNRECRSWALQLKNRKVTSILFFPGTLTATGPTGSRGFLLLLVQHLGHVALLLLLDPKVRHVIPAMEPAAGRLDGPG